MKKSKGADMNSTVMQLQHSEDALRDALQRQDWDSVGTLDLQCRQAVERALADPHTPVEELRERMQELLNLYQQLVTACNGEKSRIADELVHINHSKKKAKVYQLFG